MNGGRVESSRAELAIIACEAGASRLLPSDATSWCGGRSSWHAVQGVADDLRVFVEVLQRFCNDPQDLVEVKASEARLEKRVVSLQQQLEGSDMQVAFIRGSLGSATGEWSEE